MSFLVVLLIGSIFGSSEVAVMERAVHRDKFKELKQLPDWMSCDPEQREQLRVVSTRKMLPSAPGGSFAKTATSFRF